MPKTYFSATNPDGQIVTRASGHDYGYTHAAFYRTSKWNREARASLPIWGVTFSTSAAGAYKNAGNDPAAVVVPVTRSDKKPRKN